MKGDVDIMVTPLILESLQRYVITVTISCVHCWPVGGVIIEE